MLSDCGGRGLRPDPLSSTGVNLLPAVHSLAMTQITANLMEKTLQLTVPG